MNEHVDQGDGLSDAGRARKRVMLRELLSEVDRVSRARRVRRVAVGGAAGSVLAVAVFFGLRMTGGVGRGEAGGPRSGALVAGEATVNGTVGEGDGRALIRVRLVGNDASVLTRLVVQGSRQTIVRDADDQQLLAALNADGGSWGVARIAGRARLVENARRP